MKKYKLKKWYPSLGDRFNNNKIIIKKKGEHVYHGNGMMFKPNEIENCSEFWELITEEKVVEKDYEILSYQSIKNPEKIFRKNHPKNDSIKYLKNSWYCDQGTHIDSLNPGRLYFIHSIRRISDNKIFTISDKFKTGGYINEIHSFIVLSNNEIGLCFRDGKEYYNLSIVESWEEKKPVKLDYEVLSFKNIHNGHICNLIKDDGYYIMHDEPFTIVDFSKGLDNSKYRLNLSDKSIHRFSTKESAEEYILMNKPKLVMTTEDGKKLYSNMTEILYGVTLNPGYVDDVILTKEFKQGAGDFRGWRKWFYDTGAAEEYLLYNKPVLSLMDVAKIYVTANPKRKTPAKYSNQRERLIKLIKSKIYGEDK